MSALARRVDRPLVVVPIDTTESDDEITQAVIDAQREVGIRTTVELLIAGNRGRAHYELVRSVRRQWKAACGGQYPIEPAGLTHERSTR
ncbi:hypothetical protein GUY44_06975 [Pimelobacter simplex]|uniref:Uncharacterized protein n=1 Tax=Nocardioides simplex TaxID=2045 RepID=A0A0A1DMF6_NOCSI|nr:hypothetical protein [Pimelobacter simplex]AIY17753.1 hypothetical protein KR76_15070 [Pimelobacter simplex]MCG8150214.1 hypothetical protein [Pimelobacter simplex]GEB13576.1 hypothetical protein NSI01_18910 [Pimelobacter simplex]SFM71482.1 hypothetical protein SAMN05421671_3095 [Pimelobacter simplex]